MNLIENNGCQWREGMTTLTIYPTLSAHNPNRFSPGPFLFALEQDELRRIRSESMGGCTTEMMSGQPKWVLISYNDDLCLTSQADQCGSGGVESLLRMLASYLANGRWIF